MALSTSRPDLAPRNSPEYIGWLARYQAQQAEREQQRLEAQSSTWAQILERKRRSGIYS